MILQILYHLATAKAEAASWDYTDQASWDGKCNNDSGSSPVELPATWDLDVGVATLDISSFPTDFSYQSINTLMVQPGETAFVSFLLNWPSNRPSMLFDEKGTGEFTEYLLNDVNLHTGRAEHSVGGLTTDGSWHVRFHNSEIDQDAVIELPFKIDSASANTSIQYEIGAMCHNAIVSLEDLCSASGGATEYMQSPRTTIQANGQHFFDVLVGEQDWNAGPFVYYEGSSTTPTCDAVTKWFVWGGPIPILDAMPGYDDFRSVWDNQDGSTGNYRAYQDLGDREVTITMLIDEDGGTVIPTGSPKPEGDEEDGIGESAFAMYGYASIMVSVILGGFL